MAVYLEPCIIDQWLNANTINFENVYLLCGAQVFQFDLVGVTVKMVATGFALYDHMKNKSKLKIIENMCVHACV